MYFFPIIKILILHTHSKILIQQNNSMKKAILTIISLVLAFQVFSDHKYSTEMAKSEIKRSPKAWMLDFSHKKKWNYCHGLVLQSMLMVFDNTKDSTFYKYAEDYADDMIDINGEIKGYKLTDYNIDRVNTGKILFPLYKISGKEKYKKATYLLRSQMKTHPRTSEGGFWHKKRYPNQMWLDGLYMADPFLAQFAAEYNEPDLFNDVANQILLINKHNKDSKTGLYYHAWDEAKTQRWADKKTGLSPNFWSRSIGWYMMSIVDVLDYLPENHPERDSIIKIFRSLASALEQFRDPKTGMWYQVTAKPGKKGNYLESTGSIMFIYCWEKGYKKGYLDKSYKKKAKKAYRNYIKTFVKKERDGTLSINNCCAVAGLGGTPYRSGSYEYYISEPVRKNDPKAVGPFIMCSLLFGK